MKILLILFSFLVVFNFGIQSQTNQVENYNGQDVVRYEEIFWQIKNAPGDEEGWRKHCFKIVNDYQNFLKEYPKSELVDDAKLRIAEFYQLAGQKAKAKKWLEEIVKKHPQSDYYSMTLHKNNGEKTAAWALFYRGYWFKEKKYLEWVIEYYYRLSPKAVEQAQMILKEWK